MQTLNSLLTTLIICATNVLSRTQPGRCDCLTHIKATNNKYHLIYTVVKSSANYQLQMFAKSNIIALIGNTQTKGGRQSTYLLRQNWDKRSIQNVSPYWNYWRKLRHPTNHYISCTCCLYVVNPYCLIRVTNMFSTCTD